MIWIYRSCPRPTDDIIHFKNPIHTVFSTRIYRCRLWPAEQYHLLLERNQDFITRQARPLHDPRNFRMRLEHILSRPPYTSTQISLSIDSKLTRSPSYVTDLNKPRTASSGEETNLISQSQYRKRCRRKHRLAAGLILLSTELEAAAFSSPDL
ncbi:unnamed protein product [Brassica rapa subsp. narinosa]